MGGKRPCFIFRVELHLWALGMWNAFELREDLDCGCEAELIQGSRAHCCRASDAGNQGHSAAVRGYGLGCGS